MQELNLLTHTAVGVINRLAVEQCTHYAEVFAKFLNRHWVLAHHAHCGMASADAEKHSAGRNLIDGRDRMCGDRRDARAGNCDPGADLDAFCIGRDQRQGGVAVRPDHL